jgi:hypothetical protein
MKTMSPDLFVRYLANPLDMDAEVRRFLELPENRYYTVSVWPVGGQVRVSNLHRVVQVAKISKSSQTIS